MFSKKQLVIISFILALIFHFIFYLNEYGPSSNIAVYYINFLSAFLSILIVLLLYVGTYWRSGVKYKNILTFYDFLVIWIFICFFRSLIEIKRFEDLKPFLFNNYMGLALFPVLFFIVGINIKYFFSINRWLVVYLVLATIFTLFYINYFELQLFILMPIFYLVLTIPLQTTGNRLLIILISISVIFVSLTNRAGILRILISYCIVLAYYVMSNVKINRKFLNLIAFCILMIPAISLYMGLNGQSVFQLLSGEDISANSQLNPYADTRTFLYFEVFQDLKLNRAFLLGKGLNAGYVSEAFITYSRPIVEVGFLQTILKTGILGFVLYSTIIISAIVKSLSKARNLFMKSLGFLLVGYLLMFFIENIIAFNLLNIMIWIVVGMCHSYDLLSLDNRGIKKLFQINKPVLSSN